MSTLEYLLTICMIALVIALSPFIWAAVQFIGAWRANGWNLHGK